MYHPYLAGWKGDVSQGFSYPKSKNEIFESLEKSIMKVKLMSSFQRSNLREFFSILQAVFQREPPVVAKQDLHLRPPQDLQPNGVPPPIPPLPPELERSDSSARHSQPSAGQQPPPPPPPNPSVHRTALMRRPRHHYRHRIPQAWMQGTTLLGQYIKTVILELPSLCWGSHHRGIDRYRTMDTQIQRVKMFRKICISTLGKSTPVPSAPETNIAPRLAFRRRHLRTSNNFFLSNHNHCSLMYTL